MKLFRIALAISAFCVVIAATPFLYGRDDLWRRIGGPADQGAVDFATLKRSSRPNDYLVCQLDLCRRDKPDAAAPVFAVPAARLRDMALAAWQLENETDRKELEAGQLQFRFVRRSEWLRFPDTVSVRFVSISESTSSLAIFSRSLIGYHDFGANERRIRRWMKMLDHIPRVK